MLGVYFSLLAGEYHTFSPCISGLLTAQTSTPHTHAPSSHKPDVDRPNLDLKSSLTINALR